MSLCIALAGPPNCGKTTLFNGLTGGSGKVANHAGVTVETLVGSFRTASGTDIALIDLPGTHGLTPRSSDARLAINTLAGHGPHKPDIIIAVIDAANMRTHLQTALQVIGLGRPTILALNMADLAERDGVRLDLDALEEAVGVPVVPVRATREKGREALLETLDEFLANSEAMVSGIAVEDVRTAQALARRIADRAILSEPVMHRTTLLIDKWALHPLSGPAIFLALLFVMFQAVFSWAEMPMTMIETAIEAIATGIVTILPDGLLRDFLVEGVIAGVGAVLVFLPQILILFAFILLLESTGYLARAAFLADEAMRRIGLSGQAVIPLLSSFACAIPGIMATRTIPQERDRLTTIMIAPLMTCSARLPVYALLVGAFIPDHHIGIVNIQGLVLFTLYVTGIAGAIIVAFVHKILGGWRKTKAHALMLDLPRYKIPQIRDLLIGLRQRCLIFLRRAGSIILLTSIGVWILTRFPSGAGLRGSIAGQIGSLIEPLLRPIGFNLEISIILIPGLLAREVAVGALGIVYALDGSRDSLGDTLAAAWSLPTALAMLAWYVFAPQCLATFAAIRRETNSWRYPAIAFTYLLALAYVAAGGVFHLARALGSIFS